MATPIDLATVLAPLAIVSLALPPRYGPPRGGPVRTGYAGTASIIVRATLSPTTVIHLAPSCTS